MKRYLFLWVVFLFFTTVIFSQSATFITLSSGGQLAQVTVGTSGCTSTPLNFCGGTTGSPLSIALNGNVLYVVDNKGFLYSSTLNSSGSCTNLGQFLSGSTKMYGLTVDKNGKVYAANGTQIESFDPKQAAGNQFQIVGNVPAGFSIGGDLLFYAGQLYMACSNGALLAIDTLNPANSTIFLNFTSPSVFGFASVTVPCSNNQAFALSNASSTTNIIGVDMQNKVETGTVCTLNYRINDAASVAETQSSIPPAMPLTASPYNFCQNQTNPTLAIFPSTIKDTLRWYTQFSGGISYGNPTPEISTINSSTTNYYVSNFDTSTGCESDRSLVVVNVIDSTSKPTISIVAAQSNICVGSTTKFTSSITIGGSSPIYQWHKNGVAVSGANDSTYAPNILLDNDIIKCMITSSAACLKNPTATSNDIVIKTIVPVNNNINLFDCKVVLYKGKNYINSTVIKDTIKSLQGCDSSYNSINITITGVVIVNQANNFTGCGFVNYNNIVHTFSTTFLDTLKTILGCDSIYKTTNIIVYPNPTITATNDVYVLENTPVILNPVFGNTANVTWYPTKYLSNGNVKKPVSTPLTDQTYLITATSNNGCVDTSSMRVFIIKSVIIPNVFSPNGDGINDNWVIDNLNTYPQSKVQVYDRWGQLLFSSAAGNYKPWNGKFNGKNLPVGMYYYIISLSAIKPVMTGSLALLR